MGLLDFALSFPWTPSEALKMQEAIWVVLAVGAVSFWFFIRFLAIKQDPREPPLVPSKIPLFGHLIGLVQRKNEYYVDLR